VVSEAPIAVLRPDWPAPINVNCLTTLRLGGVSLPPFNGFNLGDHVGDDPIAVMRNRQTLVRVLGLPSEPCWLTQVHGTQAIYLDADGDAECPLSADASYTDCRARICTVMSADCLPVMFCDRQGRHVAAAHAGWRGLAAGIIESTVNALAVPAVELMVWMGPAIGAMAFEVGAEVRDAFMRFDEKAAVAFHPSPAVDGRYLTDIYALARLRLHALGIQAIYGGHWCTFDQDEAFYSYRRNGQCGRMASLIWLD
jgi:YfiH family protein